MVSSHGTFPGKLVWILGTGMELTCPLTGQRNTHVNTKKRKIHTSVLKQYSVLTRYSYRIGEHQYLRVGLRVFPRKFPQSSSNFCPMSLAGYGLWEFDIRRFCSIRRNSLLYEEIMKHHPKRHLSALYFLQMGFYDGVKCMVLTEITIYLCCSDSHISSANPLHTLFSVWGQILIPVYPPFPQRPC